MVRLLDAYKARDSVKDRELLLSALKCGKNQRYLMFALKYGSDLCFGGRPLSACERIFRL